MMFACMPAFGGDEREAILWAHSLRRWAGSFSESTILLMEPEQSPLSAAARQSLKRLGVTQISFRLPDAVLDFPYAQKVYAAAEAEQRAGRELLVWMDSDTLVLESPEEFLLPPDKKIGCCPVQLKNISSPVYEEPSDPFWQAVYSGCETPQERVFPVTTTVDGIEIRAHFNAGLLVMHPQASLLQAWAENFTRLFSRADFQPFYAANRLYRIFIHQAILSATLLAKLPSEAFCLFSNRYNVPAFLRKQYPRIVTNPIICRYDEYAFFQNPSWSVGEAAVNAKISALLEKIIS